MKNMEKKQKRSARVDKNLKLSSKQKEICLGTVITDGWIEMGAGAANPRIGLQQKKDSLPVIKAWKEELGPFAPGDPGGKLSTNPSNPTEKLPQYQLRTGRHPEFQELFKACGSVTKDKKVPALSFLQQYFTRVCLAWMLMFDGSRKSESSKGVEIHLQNMDYGSLVRFCVGLYHNLGIKCYPASYTDKEGSNDNQHTVYISGLSSEILFKKIAPLMLPSMRYKIPEPGKRPSYLNVKQSNWLSFYKKACNHPCLEDLTLEVEVFKEEM